MIRSIPGYRLHDKLYQSNRTLIFRAEREHDGQSVVLKTLSNDHPPIEELTQLQVEYLLIKELNIPHVIRVFDLVRYGSNSAMVMEDFGGVPLSTLSLQGLSLDVVLGIAIDAMAALAQIHQQNVIHQDFNGSNILFNPATREVKVIDFGISTRLNRQQPGISHGNRIEGTLQYLSPEQTGRMNCSIDYRSDHYSFGMTLFELLTGTLPFHASSAIEWVHCHLAVPPMPLGSLDADLPAVLDDILAKLLAKNAADRYQSAHGVLADLTICRRQWRTASRIDPFPIAAEDRSETFSIPEKIYGRDREIADLKAKLELTRQGVAHFAFIQGASGIGKSALVNELQRTVVERNALFLTGKFDQFRRDIPYHAFREAFAGLIKQLLGEPEETLVHWRQDLLSALSPNGSIILDVIPELEQIIGPQEQVSPLYPNENRLRFHNTFTKLIDVFAREAHPLVLFLDDWQWADGPSWDLVDHLIANGDHRCLMFVAPYRSELEEPEARLATLLNRTRDEQHISIMHLGPLTEEVVREIVSDTLQQSVDEIGDLASSMYHKTTGNPLFFLEWFKQLYKDEFINYEPTAGRWEWDGDRIQRLQITDNVVELIVDRLKKLPAQQQKLAQTAACIGNLFDITTLLAISDLPSKQLIRTLDELCEESIIRPISNQYRLLHFQHNEKTAVPLAVQFQFQHDRVQQAAYSLIDEGDRDLIHLSIGQMLMTNLAAEQKEERLIEIVQHLNHGQQLLPDRPARVELAGWNNAAGQRAMLASAFSVALRFFDIGVHLLDPRSWTSEPELATEMTTKYIECAYFCGRFDEAEQRVSEVMDRCSSPIEQSEVLRIKLTHKICIGQLSDSLALGIDALGLLNISFPRRPNQLSILKQLFKVRLLIRNRDPRTLLDQPAIAEKRLKQVYRLLTQICIASFLSNNEKSFIIAALKLVELSLKHGNSGDSANAFMCYGMLQGSIMGDYQRGYEFGKLGYLLAHRFDDLEVRSGCVLLFGGMIASWNEHWRHLGEYFKQSIQLAHQSGSYLYLSVAYANATLWNPELDLPAILEMERRHLPLIEQTNNRDVYRSSVLIHAYNKYLRSGDPSDSPFEGDDSQTDRFLAHAEENNYVLGVGIIFLYKLKYLLLNERHRAAFDVARQAGTVEKALLGQLYHFEFVLYSFLARTAYHPKLSWRSRQSNKRELKKKYRTMKTWADNCPENFLHFKHLFDAELKRLAGETLPAMEAYTRALVAIRENGYLFYEALINEWTARFYRNIGQAQIAAPFITEAYHLYHRFGAEAKTRAIRETYRSLLNPETVESGNPAVSSARRLAAKDTPVTPNGDKVPSFDLETVYQASQILSREVVLDKLLRQLMRIVHQNTGALRGLLILFDEKQQEWFIRLESQDQQTTQVEQKVSLNSDNRHFASTVINYVQRSGETVVLGNAAKQGNFTADPYILDRRCRSLLCVPIISQNTLIAILYLENGVTADVFTTDRIELTKILAAQAAISIKNALLYQNLERLVEDRTAQLKTAQDELMENAHKAGMAEIATDVLHNIGNAMNSINTEIELMKQELDELPTFRLLAVNELTQQGEPGDATASAERLSREKTQQYYQMLGEYFKESHQALDRHIDNLGRNVKTAVNIIVAQQNQHHAVSFKQKVRINRFLDDILTIKSGSLKANQISIKKRYKTQSEIDVQKTKMIHVLLNLIQNAEEAMAETPIDQREIAITTRRTEGELTIEVADNGHGIDQQNLVDIFKNGFTTKENHNGFGLHSCANYMTEMGGTLSARNKGQGAVFVVTLPANQ